MSSRCNKKMSQKMEIDMDHMEHIARIIGGTIPQDSKPKEAKLDEFEFRDDDAESEPVPDSLQRGDKNQPLCLDYFEATETVPSSYKIIRLSNGLTAFLISNSDEAEEDMAYCSLCINVGSFSDPPEFQGLAHCLEQILIQNSDPDLDEEDLNELITESGGAMENSTDFESTTFSFEISENRLKSALSSFSQYFIRPLQEKDSMPRAEEAENFKKFQLRGQQKVSQFLSSISDNKHPASKFPYADLFGLRNVEDEDALHSELVKFRDRHYSAHRMTLVLQAKIPLDLLEAYVKDCFSDVLVNWLPPDDFTKFQNPDSFATSDFKRLYKVRTESNNSVVHLTWVLPTVMEDQSKLKPHEYVSWIVSHEGRGSLLNYLRKRKWCTAISCDSSNFVYTMFTLSLTLTDQGHEHLKEVIEAVFAYVDLLHREGPQERIHEEIKEIKNIEFFFYEEYPLNYVRRISRIMHIFAPKCIVYIAHKALSHYDAASIDRCVGALAADSVNVVLESCRMTDTQLDSIEPWFSTRYSSEEFPDKWLSSWRDAKSYAEFHLPDPNRFIARNFDMIDEPEDRELPKYPQKVLETDTCEIWHRLDVQHEWPGCYVYLYLISEKFSNCVKSDVSVDLWLEILNDLLRVEVYDAVKAGLKYEIYVHFNNNIVIKVYGLNEKLPLLLKTIVKYLAESKDMITKALFNDAKTEKLSFYRDRITRPEALAKNIVNFVLQKNYWMFPDKCRALMELTFDEFKRFMETFATNMYAQCLAEGNVAQQDAIDLIQGCLETLKPGKIEVVVNPYTEVNQIKEGEHCCRVKLDKSRDSKVVTMNYYQTKEVSLKAVVLNKLLMDAVSKPMFQKLLNQEEMGYNIFCKFLRSNNIFCVAVYADPAKFPAEFADNIVGIFVNCLIDTFRGMSTEDFNVVKSSLMSSFKTASMYFKTMVDHHWYEIVCRENFFDRFDKEVMMLHSINSSDFVQWLSDNFRNSETMRKLSVQIMGSDVLMDEETKSIKKQSGGAQSCSFSLLKESGDSHISDLSKYKSTLSARENYLLSYLLTD